MKLLSVIMALVVCGLAASCKSKPLEPGNLVGTWDVIKRWGKGPLTGSIVFNADGTCETIKLPWGSITGEEAELTILESTKGKWNLEVQNGKKVVYLSFSKAKITGFGTWIKPELRSGKWTFRQYIGDPDLMDIIEFHKR
jgi:hypothetical protein